MFPQESMTHATSHSWLQSGAHCFIGHLLYPTLWGPYQWVTMDSITGQTRGGFTQTLQEAHDELLKALRASKGDKP